jgi:gamma-glutamylcyclotransferase (GGCT)/AIG2-like uncharacterized protein YtfP
MRLFCYGTLMFTDVMKRLTGRDFDAMEASLEDYGCYTVNGQVFPGMVSEAGAVTLGLVYTGVGDHLLQLLDRYEGELYRRRRVCATDTAGRPLQAWTYVIREERRGVLTKRVWDRQAFEREHLAAYLRTLQPVRAAPP